VKKILAKIGGIFRRTPEWRGPLISQAIEILGPECVVTGKQAAQAWGKNAPSLGRVSLRYHRATLEQCAAENVRGTRWFLIWFFGLSLRKQREWAEGHNGQIMYFERDDQEWWTFPDENLWADADEQSGYRLIDYSGRFGGIPHSGQSEAISRLGGCERASLSFVSEGMISIKRVCDLSVLPDWYHWSGIKDSQGKFIYLGQFAERGMWIQSESLENNDPRLRVCISRIPDF